MKNVSRAEKKEQAVFEYYRAVSDRLAAKIDAREAESETRLIFSSVMQADISRILGILWRESMPDNDIAGIEAILKRRETGEPLQYILGETEFFGRVFMVTPAVLIPRHDTECVIGAALHHVDASNGTEKLDVLDIGAGSGAICLTLALERPSRVEITAVDISAAALAVAKMNAEMLGARVKFLVSDVFGAFAGTGIKFDIIISNPPYIRENEYENLAREVKFEPVTALVARDSGLEFYKRIIDGAFIYLKPGGALIFEIGYDMAPDIAKYAFDKGIMNSSIYYDIEKRPRGLKLWA